MQLAVNLLVRHNTSEKRHLLIVGFNNGIVGEYLTILITLKTNYFNALILYLYNWIMQQIFVWLKS
jgi:hypothetical protein